MRYFRKSFLRGGLYHLALIFVTASAFNWGFMQLFSVDLAGRLFSGLAVPDKSTALALCISSILVLWNNWVD